MARMGLDAVLRGQRRRVGDTAQFGGARFAGQMGIGAGVQFHDRDVQPDRRVDLGGVGFDEQADADARIIERRDDRL